MRSLRAAAIVILLSLMLTGCSTDPEDDGSSPSTAVEPSPTSSAGAADSTDASSVTFEQSNRPPPRSNVAGIVARALPAVVNVQVGGEGNALDDGGEASGVVIDPSGIVLTNAHVVGGAAKVTLVLNRGEQGQEKIVGDVVGTSVERDIAVVRADATNLPAMELGRSSSLRLGDDVITIGFPLGLGGSPTVTRGIISAQNRTIEVGDPLSGTRELKGLLQTDAAINPGNSGGALIDLNGRLVGINTAAAGASLAENIGFAIEIDDALKVVKEILNEPEQGFLGVAGETLTPELAVQLGLDPDLEGAVIGDIVPNTPAEEAGLQQGQVIVSVDGVAIESQEELFEELKDRQPGESVTLVIVDSDGTRDVKVELTRRSVKRVEPDN